MSKIKPSIPKGTQDFPPEAMAKREYIFDILRQTFRKYGYMPLETPSFERLDVLTGKYGEEGDRLIFKILNSGDYLSKVKQDISEATSTSLTPEISEKALRYDLTVPFARFVVMNQQDLALPFKRYQIQPVWRADRPQKGRYREFYQCDADVVGTDSLIYDAELAALFHEGFSKLGISDIQILLNNRKILSGIADVIEKPEKLGEICIAIDKLDKIGVEGVRAELTRRGFTDDESSHIFKIIGFQGTTEEKLGFLKGELSGSELGIQGVTEMGEVFEYLKHFGINDAKIIFDLGLARGLDYYTGTIYEIACPSVGIGSLGGGGRYADLTGIFGLQGMPGVGISFGASRIQLAMEELGLFKDLSICPTKVLLVNFGGDPLKASIGVLANLRAAGLAAEIYPDNAKLKKQYKYADKKGIPFVLAIGDEEMKTGQYLLKDLKSGEQEAMGINHIIQKLI